MAQRSGKSGNVENLVAVFLFIINAKNDALTPHNDDYVPREAYNQTKYSMDTKKNEPKKIDMIKVLKETPITWNGHDLLEQLVVDSDSEAELGCNHCIYKDFAGFSEVYADCCTIHGCGMTFSSYFRLTALPQK